MAASIMTVRRSSVMAAVVLAITVWTSPEARGAQAANDMTCELHQPPRNGILTTCSGPFAPQAAQIAIALAGTAPNRVHEIRLSSGDDAAPFQIIPVEAQPVIDIETVGILFMDMNFDGHADLAIMRSLAAGYRYFLYDPDSGRFAASDELDAVAWPEFDHDSRTVRSYYERADGTSGHETLAWSDGRLRVIETR